MNWSIVIPCELGASFLQKPLWDGEGGVLEILLGMRRLLLGIPIDYSLLYGEL